MKKVFIVLLSCILLAGCRINPAAMEDYTPMTVPTEPETQPAATVPPDPMEVLLDSMREEDLVGQLFLVRYPGHEAAKAAAEAYHIGGFILFGQDYREETPDSIAAQMETLQQTASLPLLIATDEEGGDVARVSAYSQYRDSRFSSPRKLFDKGGLSLALETEAEKCLLLRRVGVNVNMGPVCDVTTDPNAFMYKRSLGQDVQTTGQFVAGMVETMAQHKIGSVLKHFPGYGNNVDTHVGTAVDSRSLEALEATDLVPFQAGIHAGCDAILVSHTIVECLDKEHPASLSPAVVDYLRRNMGFGGVIVTDDLVMDAITDKYGVGESAVMAVLAGCDLLCSSDYEQQYAAVLAAVKDGTIPQQQLRDSVERVLRWKLELGLLEL